MSTKIETLWQAMNDEIARGNTDSTGWVLRLAQPTARCPLFAAVQIATKRRAVLLRLPADCVPPQHRWPQCKGLEPIVMKVGDEEYFGVVLKELRFTDVFVSLVVDLLRRVSEASTPALQASAFLGQLSRWQKFLSASSDQLSSEQQRGLWGELKFIRDHFYPVLGAQAVAGWKGPQGASQDFQFEAGAIEVKTTLAAQPQVVRISSERQLDDSAWPLLLMCVLVLEARDDSGETLPEMIQAVRALLLHDTAATELLEDSLLQAGYHESHTQQYAAPGYFIRDQTTLEVKNDFPRLTEHNLPAGIGNINYGLSISACAAYAMSEARTIQALTQINSTATQ